MIELLLVITVLGVLTVISVPKLARTQEQGAVRSARQQVGSYLVTARAVAIRRSRPATFRVVDNQIFVTLAKSDTESDTVAAVIPLDDVYAVSLFASQNSVGFDTRGLPTNLAGTQVFRVSRGSSSDSVCISRGGVVGKCGF